MNFIKKRYGSIGVLDRGMEWLSPLFLLGLRGYVASVFFKSGLTKIQDFSSTVALFENEYKVPVISPTLAAVSGTAVAWVRIVEEPRVQRQNLCFSARQP